MNYLEQVWAVVSVLLMAVVIVACVYLWSKPYTDIRDLATRIERLEATVKRNRSEIRDVHPKYWSEGADLADRYKEE